MVIVNTVTSLINTLVTVKKMCGIESTQTNIIRWIVLTGNVSSYLKVSVQLQNMVDTLFYIWTVYRNHIDGNSILLLCECSLQ